MNLFSLAKRRLKSNPTALTPTSRVITKTLKPNSCWQWQTTQLGATAKDCTLGSSDQTLGKSFSAWSTMQLGKTFSREAADLHFWRCSRCSWLKALQIWSGVLVLPGTGDLTAYLKYFLSERYCDSMKPSSLLLVSLQDKYLSSGPGHKPHSLTLQTTSLIARSIYKSYGYIEGNYISVSMKESGTFKGDLAGTANNWWKV